MSIKAAASHIEPELRARLERLTCPATAARLRRLAPSPDDRVLEIGSGPGQYRYAVRGHYVGLDITTDPYKEGLPRYVDVVGDAEALPFAEGAFDVVFLSNTFYHFRNGAGVLEECRRTLAPGGQLLLFDYSRRTLEQLKRSYELAGVYMQVRCCSEWLELLLRMGFVDVSLRANSSRGTRRAARALMPRQVYRACIDRLPGSIVVAGRKPVRPQVK